jgi:GalNAc-alpha-(1->4)-GalNAc-alpha-(1->3)-diNAcBac-PP-undecaprenol alpha-1,4-N-acetyl-D-galactosaminyltransferase
LALPAGPGRRLPRVKPFDVAFVKNGFDNVDGSAEHLVNYAIALKHAGCAPVVWYTNPSASDNQYIRFLREAEIEARYLGAEWSVYEHRLRRLASGFRGQGGERTGWAQILERGLADVLRRRRVALVHAFVDPTAPLALRAAKRAGVPSLCQELISPRPSPATADYYDELAALLPHSTLAAQSKRLAQECQDRIPYAGVVEIIPNIVEDPGELTKPSASRSDVTIGFASRFEPRKAPEVLVKAFARALRVDPRLVLRMAGDGPLRPEVLRLAEELGIVARCEFPGAYAGRSDRQAFFRSIDVLVQPSRAEGLPNAVLEAMAYGRTIVCTDGGGIRDFVDEESAIFVRADDVDDLAAALVRVGDAALRERLGRRARDIYSRSFAPAVVLPQLLGAYARAMAGSLPR